MFLAWPASYISNCTPCKKRNVFALSFGFQAIKLFKVEFNIQFYSYQIVVLKLSIFFSLAFSLTKEIGICRVVWGFALEKDRFDCGQPVHRSWLCMLMSLTKDGIWRVRKRTKNWFLMLNQLDVLNSICFSPVITFTSIIMRSSLRNMQTIWKGSAINTDSSTTLIP